MEFTKVTNNLSGDLNLTYVYLWDLGPSKPVAPKRPDTPAGKKGEPEYDLAMIEFRGVLEKYDEDLRAYGRDKINFAEWQKKQGGPIEMRFWSVDAADALERDPKRYCVSARTRGYGNRPNQGLPEGMKPGKGHFENQARIAAGESDLEAARRSDPVFGQQEVRE
jgi:hypothetical protein